MTNKVADRYFGRREFQIQQTSDGRIGVLIYSTKTAAEKQARIYRKQGTPCKVIPYESPAARAFKLVQQIAKVQRWEETAAYKEQLPLTSCPQQDLDWLENQVGILESIIEKAREIA